MPLPIPGSGILAVLVRLWQTCFYGRGKVLASSSLAVKICREDLSRKAAKGAKRYRVSKTGFFAALRLCARSIFFPRGLRALFVQLLQPFNEPYQPILRLLAKRLMMGILHAGVAKLVYAPDSKSGVRQGHVGSSPTSGTMRLFMNKSLLWGLAAACNFLAAALTYYGNGRVLIISIQLLAGLLMVVVAVKNCLPH